MEGMDSSKLMLLLMHCPDDYAEEQSAVVCLGLLDDVQTARIGSAAQH
jgi:hypothetical protein